MGRATQTSSWSDWPDLTCPRLAGFDLSPKVHGLRYTFTDLVRLANVDAVVRRALTGHVTEEMQRHYSTVGLDEKRAAIRGVLRLVPPAPTTEPASTTGSGVSGGFSEVVLKIAS